MADDVISLEIKELKLFSLSLEKDSDVVGAGGCCNCYLLTVDSLLSVGHPANVTSIRSAKQPTDGSTKQPHSQTPTQPSDQPSIEPSLQPIFQPKG